MSHLLILPLAAGVLAQVIKIFINSNDKAKSWKNIADYSGMPSGHSALVVSLATIVGLEEGWNSSVFALSFILAIIIIRDALGIRRYLGRQSRFFNVLVKDLDEDNVLDRKYPRLLEKIGHTPLQVLAGSLIGFTVSLLGYWLLG